MFNAAKQRLVEPRMVDLMDEAGNDPAEPLGIARGLEPGAMGINLAELA